MMSHAPTEPRASRANGLVVALALLLLVGCRGPRPVLTPRGDIITPASFVGRTAELDGLLGQPMLDPAGVLDARASLADRLDLAQLHALAATRNPELRRLRAEIIAAEGKLQQAGAWPNPRLSVEASQIPVDSVGSLGDMNVAAGFRQQLPVSGRTGVAERVARAGLSAREAHALARARELELAVSATFVRYHAAWERARVLAEVVRRRDDQLGIVQREAEQGRVPTLDVLDARDALAQARLAQLQAESELADVRATLREAVGDPELVIGPPPVDWRLPEQPLYLDRIREPSWVVSHPLVIAANHEVTEAETAVEGAGLSHQHDAELRAGYLYTGADDGHWLTAQLLLPLSVFDQSDGAIREQRARAVAAAARRDGAIVHLLARLDRALRTRTAARERLRLYDEELLPAARQREELARRQAVSRVSTRELNEVEIRRLLLEADLWRARSDLAVAIHELRALLGE